MIVSVSCLLVLSDDLFIYLSKNKQQRAQQATNVLIKHMYNTIHYQKTEK